MIVELCKMHKKCDKKRDIMTEMIFHVDKMKEKERQDSDIKKAQLRERLNDDGDFAIFEKIDNDIN